MPKCELDAIDCRIIAARSNIAIQTLKAGAPLPLQHLEGRAAD
jgi:hypothetical protein